MKLWHSFVKELILSSRSFYFYVELLMAALILFLLLFVIPESFDSKADEYIYWDIPEAANEFMVAEYLAIDVDGIVETVEYQLEGETVVATLYEDERRRLWQYPKIIECVVVSD